MSPWSSLSVGDATSIDGIRRTLRPLNLVLGGDAGGLDVERRGNPQSIDGDVPDAIYQGDGVANLLK
jgi:hypothetical protein